MGSVSEARRSQGVVCSLSEELDTESRMRSKEGIWSEEERAGTELLGAYDSELHLSSELEW